MGPKLASAFAPPLAHAVSLSYYGHVEGVNGDPGNPTSSMARAMKCTPSGNVAMMLDWVKALRVGEWRACDVGTADGTRVAETITRVCETASSTAWVDPDNQMFVGAAQDVLAESGVDLATVRFGDYEVLKYGPGSFFAAHADRTRGDGHIGTLIAVVASEDAVGGELYVDEERVGKDKPYLVFLPLGRVHSVTPITAGTRYVAKAAVYGNTSASAAANDAFMDRNMRSD